MVPLATPVSSWLFCASTTLIVFEPLLSTKARRGVGGHYAVDGIDADGERDAETVLLVDTSIGVAVPAAPAVALGLST